MIRLTEETKFCNNYNSQCNTEKHSKNFQKNVFLSDIVVVLKYLSPCF